MNTAEIRQFQPTVAVRFLSLCSGIEAASVAWSPLGWKAWAFSEIDKFPCAVLAHHYPDTPNLGDMNRFKDWPDATLDVLCGGTPCQSFSNAGLRQGLRDPRGNLMLTFGAVAARYRPRWLVWENVPGVLSSGEGRDFGAFLGLLGFLGYGFAYRVFDAQFVRVDGYGRAVPQRRQRVFVVGCLGDWRSAAAVLLERESLRGDPAPRRSSGARVAATLTRGAESSGKGGYAGRRANRANPQPGDPCHPLAAGAHAPAVAFNVSVNSNGFAWEREHAPALDSTGGSAPNQQYGVRSGALVRRLMPVECERLQGFPDSYTQIPWRGKPASECPDGPRYKALGNSWAVNCARWIGWRIAMVDSLPTLSSAPVWVRPVVAGLQLAGAFE